MNNKSRRLKAYRCSERSYYRPSAALSSGYQNDLFKKSYETQRKLLSEFDIERRSIKSRQHQRSVLDTSTLNELNKELRDMKRANSGYCTYITSYQINKELEKVKSSPANKREEANIKCISNITALHMQRLNIKPKFSSSSRTRNVMERGWTASTL